MVSVHGQLVPLFLGPGMKTTIMKAHGRAELLTHDVQDVSFLGHAPSDLVTPIPLSIILSHS
jgi:hypothetical protein